MLLVVRTLNVGFCRFGILLKPITTMHKEGLRNHRLVNPSNGLIIRFQLPRTPRHRRRKQTLKKSEKRWRYLFPNLGHRLQLR